MIDAVSWTLALAGLSCIVLALLRPPPEIRPPISARVITDMTGRKVAVRLPFTGVGMTWGSSLREFYTVTRSPESVLEAWPFAQLEVRGTVLGDLFPRQMSHTKFWQASRISNGQGPNANVETILQSGASVFFGYSNMAPVMERVGVPFAGGVLVLREPLLFPAVRMMAGSVGEAEHGEELIHRYHEDVSELEKELRPETVARRPSVLMATVARKASREGSVEYGGRVNQFWRTMFERAGVVNAVDDSNWLIQRNAYATGVERLLSLDPDVVILTDGLYEKANEHAMGPEEFIADPRFRAMRAVTNRRVYRYPRGFTVNMFGIIETPIATRWLAELAHPDLLARRTRALLQKRIRDDLNIDLSDGMLDRMLSTNENHGMLYADRFEVKPNVAKEAE